MLFLFDKSNCLYDVFSIVISGFFCVPVYITLQPASINIVTMLLPIPLVPPVTNAVFPVKSICLFSPSKKLIDLGIEYNYIFVILLFCT